MGIAVPGAYTGTASWASAANTAAATGGGHVEGAIYGSCFISTPANTVIATVNVPIKAAGATTAGLLNGFTHTSPGKLTYTGSLTGRFLVNVVGVIDPAANSKD